MTTDDALEAEFRGIRSGGGFPHPELLDVQHGESRAWNVVAISTVSASTPLSNGAAPCRAYGYLLAERNDTTPWVAVAVFCERLLESGAKKPRRIPTWPLYARTSHSLGLNVQLVQALDPSHVVLWVSDRATHDGDLTATEHIFVRQGNVLTPILTAVGCDPAAGMRATHYEAAFFGESFPRRFRTICQTAGPRISVEYQFSDGLYRPLGLR